MLHKPKVAVIGAGIFGITCALELSKKCDVVIYEQNAEIMQGGTFGNQYRHHFGYHYPRSAETVAQCLSARETFESVWGSVLTRSFGAYYAVAKEGSKITAQNFIKFCDLFKLPYTVEFPTKEWLNRDAVDVCIKTPEPVYDYQVLKNCAYKKLKEKSGISLLLSSEVVGLELQSDHIELRYRQGHSPKSATVDYVVNAMYSNHNLLHRWLQLPASPLEYRLKELAVVRLPVTEHQAITIMDGPFVTLVPIGGTGLYTLGDVARSIHEVTVSSDGQPWGRGEDLNRTTRFPEMQRANPFFVPIIRDAEYVRSIFTVLPVRPTAEATDERITTVTREEKRIWSVFEGKIVTCVDAARQVAKELFSAVN